jgi:hypothetical protein
VTERAEHIHATHAEDHFLTESVVGVAPAQPTTAASFVSCRDGGGESDRDGDEHARATARAMG